MARSSRERLLSRMLAEARAQKPPELALDSVQRRVYAELRAAVERGDLVDLVTSRTPARGPRALGWLAAAALTLGALWALTWGDGPSSSLPAETAEVAGVSSRDGALLEAGATVVAPDVAVSVEHAHRATWVLAPGSRARLLSTTPGALRVELEQGALDAAVVPSQRPASFVVVAAGTEVAVHGTRFGVSLDGDRATVTVSEGEVLVSAIGQGLGTLLGAGMQVEFIVGVAQQGAELRPTAPSEPEAAALGASPTGTTSSSPPGAGTTQRIAPAKAPHGQARRGAARLSGRAARAASPSGASSSSSSWGTADALGELASKRVTERIQSCFRRHTRGRGELSIEASTRLRLLVQPDGSILEARLEPPLAPAVERCVADDLAALELGTSAEGYRVDREIRLSR